MSAEREGDPRDRRLRPTAEEIDAWAAREHKRRAAWAHGPSADEKQDWARRYRWRAAVGLGESRLGPAQEDIEHWAEREHKRRQAWLAGPSDSEKRMWADRAQRGGGVGDPAPPSDDAVEEWAAREKQRRQEWLAGPSEHEKQDWAERQGRGFLDDLLSLPGMLESTDFPETAQRFLRDAELAGKGTVYALSRAPLRLWSYLIRAGQAFEEDTSQQPRRRRVRY
jgi:hypothetical protein